MRDAAEMAEDIAVHDRAKALTNAARVPGEVVRRLIDDELLVWLSNIRGEPTLTLRIVCIHYRIHEYLGAMR